MKSKTFKAQLEFLHPMLEFVQNYCASKQFNSEITNKIVLCTEEALVNVINYSYPQSEGNLRITCKDTKNRPGMTILIKDKGIPFNPIAQSPIKKDQPPPPPSLEGKKGGYGIYIFVGIMDRVDYRRLEDGNLLSMTKYLH